MCSLHEYVYRAKFREKKTTRSISSAKGTDF